MRSGERAVFAGERGCGDLRDHETGVEAGIGGEEGREQAGERVGHLLDATLGDASQSGERDGNLVGGHSERLTMEIAAADDVAMTFFIYEN